MHWIIELVSEKKNLIRDIIEKVIIKERKGRSLNSTQKLGHEPISRNRCYTVPTLEFKFNFKLPEPRKERIIAQRDGFGRIIRSIPPEMRFEAASNPSYGLLQS